LQTRLETGVCEFSGIPFSKRKDKAFTPSLDRIDSKKGYTYDNVRIVCFIFNVSFMNWGDQLAIEAWQKALAFIENKHKIKTA